MSDAEQTPVVTDPAAARIKVRPDGLPTSMSCCEFAAVMVGGPIQHPALADRIRELIAEHCQVIDALQAVITHYTTLVDSGDCGNWEPRDEPPIKNALTLLVDIGAISPDAAALKTTR